MRILIILLLLCSAVRAEGTFTVVSGYGYFTDDKGNIVSLATLPVGEHPIKDGYTYTEVANKTELDAVILFKPIQSADLNTINEREDLIRAKIRELAIEDLVAEGKWKPEFDNK